MFDVKQQALVIYNSSIKELTDYIYNIQYHIKDENLENQVLQLLNNFKTNNINDFDIIKLMALVKILLKITECQPHKVNLEEKLCLSIIETAFSALHAKAIYESSVLVDIITEIDYE